jgi:hypothetical protein
MSDSCLIPLVGMRPRCIVEGEFLGMIVIAELFFSGNTLPTLVVRVIEMLPITTTTTMTIVKIQ